MLSTDVTSPLDVPPFANSSMDGFAVRSTDTSQASHGHPVRLAVTQHIAAGTSSPVPVPTGQAARIMTGAPLPPGADAVVPFEEVSDQGDSIALTTPVFLGACVRPAGNDVRAGEPLLTSGTVVGPRHIGLLASIGLDTISVARRPTVGIMSTGDELVPPGTPLAPGQIYNSNTPMLATAVVEAGGVPLPVHAVVDDPEQIREALTNLSSCDFIVTSGGASVGDHDHMRAILSSSGTVEFWRVRLRPGKPLLFGSIDGTPVVGLPGNPTSSMVTYELFVRPALRLMLGADIERPRIKAIVDERIDNRGGRRTYFRVRLHFRGGRYHAALSGKQDSGMLLPLALADGLLVVSEDCEEVQPGDEGTVLVWGLPADGGI